MKKIKIISFMLLTILSCLKFATATEKNQSPIENAYEKTQNNQLEEEKEDEKLVENGASKKEILLENGASKKEILLENGADKEEIFNKDAIKKEIFNKDADKKEIFNKDADKKEIFNKDAIKKAILKKDANEKEILNLPLQRFINMFEKEKKHKNNLIENMCKQLETINELIKNNRESFNDNSLFSDLEELKQNLLDYQKKINTKSNVPKDLENLAKKIYAYTNKLNGHANFMKYNKNDKKVKDAYEQFRNFAYLDYFAKNHEYNNAAMDFFQIINSINNELNSLRRQIIYIYDHYVIKLKNNLQNTQNTIEQIQMKLLTLKNMISNLDIFEDLLKQYSPINPEQLVENKDRHKIVSIINKACHNFVEAITSAAEQAGLDTIKEKIWQCPRLTYFSKETRKNADYYEYVSNLCNNAINYFEKSIDANDKDTLSSLNRTKQKMAEISKIINSGYRFKYSEDGFNNIHTIEQLYEISSGFVTEIPKFFKLMSDYYRKNKKIGLSTYLKILNPLQNLITDSKYSRDVKNGIIKDMEEIKVELKKLKLLFKKEKHEDKNYITVNKLFFTLEQELFELNKKINQTDNREKIDELRYELAYICDKFKKNISPLVKNTKINKYFENDKNNQDKNNRDKNNQSLRVCSYSKYVPANKRNELTNRLKLINDNIDRISANFEALPKEYYTDNLKQYLKEFKSNLNDMNHSLENHNFRYFEFDYKLYSLIKGVSNLIKNAIQPLVAKQNSEYNSKISEHCLKILDSTAKLKNSINLLKNYI